MSREDGIKKFGEYVLNFVLSLLFHWYWCIPAIILLILHFVLGISIWWAVGAFVLFVVGVRIFVHVLGWLVYMGNQDERPSKNKNPYSNNRRKTEKSKISDPAGLTERRNDDFR